jgi:hypothetical protein
MNGYDDVNVTVVVRDSAGNQTQQDCTLVYAWLKESITLEYGNTLTVQEVLFSPELSQELVDQKKLDEINVSKPGTYTISSVSGEKTQTCTITIQDTTAPVLKLKEVVIADTVSVIPEKCFKYCESLTKVTARSVTQIEDNAFDSCVKLNTVTFSASLNFVGDGAFLRAGEQAKTFSVRLAGTADEWAAAKAEMDADENDELAIWTGNEKLLTALEAPAFVERPQQDAASD